MRVRLLASLLCLTACRRDVERPPPTTQIASPPTAVASASTTPPVVVPEMAVATAPAEVPVASLQKAPAPLVDVRSIGMHIGGGPNDDLTKAPFLAAIAASHAELATCWAALGKRTAVDFGADFLVPAKGGLAKVDRPRSTVQDPAFVRCATAAFGRVVFAPGKSGLATKVSTSVRLTPK